MFPHNLKNIKEAEQDKLVSFVKRNPFIFGNMTNMILNSPEFLEAIKNVKDENQVIEIFKKMVQ